MGDGETVPAERLDLSASALDVSLKVAALEECRELAIPEKTRQGDVLQWIDPAVDEVWRRFGVVVTADCDIAWRKHRGIVSYCPILTLDNYLQLFWFPEQLRRHEERLSATLHADIVQLQKEYSDLTEPVSAGEIPSWLEDRGPQGVVEDLKVPDGKRQALLQRLELYQRVARAKSSQDVNEQVAAMAFAKAGSLRAEDGRKREQDVWKDFQGHKLPGDWFFLTRLPGGHDGGFIVYLRRIQEIPENQIAIEPDTERNKPGTVTARRLGRMNSPFLYRLTQQLAAVFADIGLPQEYEKMCDDTVRAFTDRRRPAAEGA